MNKYNALSAHLTQLEADLVQLQRAAEDLLVGRSHYVAQLPEGWVYVPWGDDSDLADACSSGLCALSLEDFVRAQETHPTLQHLAEAELDIPAGSYQLGERLKLGTKIAFHEISLVRNGGVR